MSELYKTLECSVCHKRFTTREMNNLQPTVVGGMMGVVHQKGNFSQLEIDLCSDHWKAAINFILKLKDLITKQDGKHVS